MPSKVRENSLFFFKRILLGIRQYIVSFILIKDYVTNFLAKFILHYTGLSEKLLNLNVRLTSTKTMTLLEN